MREAGRFRALLLSLLGAALTSMDCSRAAAGTMRQQLALDSCAALQAQAAALPGRGPMLLPSYPGVDANGPLKALAQLAFVYDNAAAGIAFTACGQPAQARRIADALLIAMAHDPSFHDGRLRNAYHAGAIDDHAALPGYWDKAGGYWSQDPYQTGTATGNVAWAALLLLTVYENTRDPRYLDAALAQLAWLRTHVANTSSPAGYDGGLFGYDNAQRAQHWKSTEHNIDVHAAATWAARYNNDSALAAQARLAGSFVRAMWDASEHRFLVGTQDDGHTPARDFSGLDAQVWPLLAFAAPPASWRLVWPWVQAEHHSGAGYGFGRHPDGAWTEGSAQVADALQASGRAVPDRLWQFLAAQRSPQGLYYATPQARIATGLAIGPTSHKADFFYYHLPHLGATAWIALTATGWNPFTGHAQAAAPAR